MCHLGKNGTGKCNVTSHPSSTKRITRCSLCEQSFSTTQALRFHNKETHKYLDSNDDVEQSEYVLMMQLVASDVTANDCEKRCAWLLVKNAVFGAWLSGPCLTMKS